MSRRGDQDPGEPPVSVRRVEHEPGQQVSRPKGRTSGDPKQPSGGASDALSKSQRGRGGRRTRGRGRATKRMVVNLASPKVKKMPRESQGGTPSVSRGGTRSRGGGVRVSGKTVRSPGSPRRIRIRGRDGVSKTMVVRQPGAAAGGDGDGARQEKVSIQGRPPRAPRAAGAPMSRSARPRASQRIANEALRENLFHEAQSPAAAAAPAARQDTGTSSRRRQRRKPTATATKAASGAAPRAVERAPRSRVAPAEAQPGIVAGGAPASVAELQRLRSHAADTQRLHERYQALYDRNQRLVENHHRLESLSHQTKMKARAWHEQLMEAKKAAQEKSDLVQGFLPAFKKSLADVESLKAQAAEKESQLQASRSEIARLQRDSEDAKTRLRFFSEQFTVKNRDVFESNEKLQHDVDEMRSRVEQVNHDNRFMKQQVAEIARRNTSLQERNEQLQKDMTTLAEKNSMVVLESQQISDIGAALKRDNEALTLLNQDLLGKNRALADLVKALDTKATALEENVNEKAVSLEKLEARTSTIRDHTHASLEHLKKENSSLRDKVFRMTKGAADQTVVFTGTRTRLEADLSEKDARVRDLQARCEELDLALQQRSAELASEKSQREVETTSLGEDVKKLRELVRMSKLSSQELRSECETRNLDHTRKANHLTEMVDLLKRNRDDLQEQVARLENVKNQAEREVRRLADREVNLIRTTESLKEDREDLEKQLQELRDKDSERSEELLEAFREKRDAEAETLRSQAQMRAAQTQVGTLQQQYAALEIRNKDLAEQVQLNDARGQEMGRLQNLVEELTTKSQTLESQVSEYFDNLARVQSNLEAVTTERDKVSHHLAELRKKYLACVQRMKGNMQQHSEDKRGLVTQMDEQRNVMLQMEAQRDQALRERDTVVGDLQALKAEMGSLLGNLQSQTAVSEDRQAVVDRMKAAISDMRAREDSAQANAQALMQQSEALQSRVNAYEDRCSLFEENRKSLTQSLTQRSLELRKKDALLSAAATKAAEDRAALESQLEAKHQLITELQERLRVLSAQSDDATSKNFDQNLLMNEFREKLEQAEKEKAGLVGDREFMDQEAELQRKKAEKYHNDLLVEMDKNLSLVKENSDLRTDLNRGKDELLLRQRELAKMKQAVSVLREAVAEMQLPVVAGSEDADSLSQMVESLRSKEVGLLREKDRLDKEVSILNQTLVDKDRSVSVLSAQCESLKKQLVASRGQIATLAEKFKLFQSRQSQDARLVADERDSYMKSAQETLPALDRVRQENERLSSLLALATQERDSIADDLRDREAELRRMKNDSEERIVGLSRRSDEMNDDYVELSKQLGEKSTQLSTLAMQKSALEEEEARLRNRLEEMKREQEEYRRRKKLDDQQKERFEERFREYTSRLSSLTASLIDVTAKNQTLMDRNVLLNEQMAASRRDMREIRARVKKMKSLGLVKRARPEEEDD